LSRLLRYNRLEMKARLDTSRIAWIAILAIIWHACMPLLHASGMSQEVLSSICSTGAPRQELIQLPAGKQDAPAAELLKQCPLCASGAHFAVADEAAPRFVPDASLAHVQSSVSSIAARHVFAWLNFSPRAPPQA
jgi:hypothetical protein